MSPHPHTEDQLVKQPANGLFGVLGWQTVSALAETVGSVGNIASTLGRETMGEMAQAGRLRAALDRLTPGASIEDEGRWDEYLSWLAQRLVKMDQVLRPVVKGLP